MSDFMQALSSGITAAVAVLALVYAYKQTKLARTGHFAERRPYIVPSYEVKDSSRGEKSVYLVIANYGNTPAKDVTLQFSPHTAWNYVKSANHFPFLPENKGISVIPPGTRTSYFVGILSPKSDLHFLREEEITVSVEFGMYEQQERIIDSFRLSLKDFAGSVSLPRKSASSAK